MDDTSAIVKKWSKVLSDQQAERVYDLPRVEWTEHLTECLESVGVNHPDIKSHIKENNRRGYAVFLESQERWCLPEEPAQ